MNYLWGGRYNKVTIKWLTRCLYVLQIKLPPSLKCSLVWNSRASETAEWIHEPCALRLTVTVDCFVTHEQTDTRNTPSAVHPPTDQFSINYIAPNNEVQVAGFFIVSLNVKRK